MAEPVLTVGSLALVEEQWEIRAQPHVQIRLKHLFQGAIKGRVDEVHLSHTDENCRDLLWFLDRYPLEMDKASRTALRAGARRYVKRAAKIIQIMSGDYQIPSVSMALQARPYQEQAAAAVLNTGGLLLVDELGLGKTCSAIRVMADPRALPALCVVPAPLTDQWASEIAKFVPALRVHIASSYDPYDIAKRDGQDPDVVIISYNKLPGWADDLEGKMRLVVFDEAQELRTGHTDAYKSSKKNLAAAQVARTARFRLGLTATPIYNYGAELWNVIDILCPGQLGSRPEFLREWCVGNDRKATVRDPQAFGSYLRQEGMLLRRTRADVGRQLPPVSRVVHEIHADFAASFWDTRSAAVELARIVLDKSAKNFTQMQAAGQLNILLRQATGVAKAPHVAAFVRMLLDQDIKNVVLFGWHREVYGIWDELLGDLGVAWYTGSESVAKKRKEVNRFREGDARILVMSLRSGLGFDGLQEVCSTAVHGELDWSPSVHAQCNGRLRRDGQPDPVFAYYPVSDSGSDPIICDVLGLKTAQLEGIRDPGGAALTMRDIDPDHIKKLAAEYLRRFGGS